MKLAASCRKHLAVLLVIGGAIAASSRLSSASPQAADNARGTRFVLFIVDHCEPSGLFRESIIDIEAITDGKEDTEPAFKPFTDPRDLLNGDGLNLCDTVLLIVPLPEPDQNTIAPLDAAVWSRSGQRMGAATQFP